MTSRDDGCRHALTSRHVTSRHVIGQRQSHVRDQMAPTRELPPALTCPPPSSPSTCPTPLVSAAPAPAAATPAVDLRETTHGTAVDRCDPDRTGMERSDWMRPQATVHHENTCPPISVALRRSWSLRQSGSPRGRVAQCFYGPKSISSHGMAKCDSDTTARYRQHWSRAN